ncbi:acyl transferase/acyl hydrolase/lysophospholipase [Flagelloscypha sp. PMI_526]|nr:acyl transferase/acyl hydrolase/lysophospholipase [Flagelloscypha sp. PMI_526]
MTDRGIRILVVDGEGSPAIGVIPSIGVLNEMMSRIEFDIKANEESILPCQYFDLIVGSGDGGLISLMLGRLGMSASSAKAAYEEIHEFIHESCANLDSNAKAQALEGRLKNLVCKEVGGDDPDLERLEEPASTKPRCKVAVLTKSALNIGAPVILRTYRVRDNRTPNCPIWLAMRASTARPNIFTEARVCGKKLISASLGHNNPIESAMHEASIAFPTARIDCIVSLGSGHPGHSELKETGLSSLALVALQLAQGSEQVSQEFARRRQSEGLGDTYFRFNVLQGLQAYIQAGYDSALAHTAAYLQETAVDTALNAAVRALRGESQSVISSTSP